MSRKKQKKFIPVGSTLNQFLHRFGIAPHVQEAGVLSAWKRVASSTLGKHIAEQTKPVAGDGDELVVVTSHPIFSQEIQQKSGRLLEQMNALLGEGSITKIRTRLGSVR